jgi:hypothetical protein
MRVKVDATTIDELILKSGPHAESIRQLDAAIMATAPTLQRRLFSGPSITMIGYGELVWENMSSSGVWPVIAVAPQKHQISMYVAADVNGTPLVQIYGDRLGPTNNGKNCVRFKRFEDLNETELISFIKDAVTAAAAQETVYGRNCAQPVDS